MSRTILDEMIAELDGERPSSRFRSNTGPDVSTLETLRRNRSMVQNAVDIVRERAANDSRALQRSEQDSIAKADDRLELLDQRINELTDAERREALNAQARVESGNTGEHRSSPAGGVFGSGARHTGGGETYTRSPNSPSFLKDLVHAKRGDADAADRLRMNNREQGMDSRVLGSTNGTGGSGGEFSPPAYLISDFVAIARAGSVTANLFTQEEMPMGVSSLNVPKVQTGTSVAPQTTQNTVLASTDPTTSMLSSGITTLAGRVVVSRQLLDQTPDGLFDKMLMQDLASEHARALGVQAINGTGTAGQLRGYLAATSTSTVSYTSTTPTAVGIYQKLAVLQGQINATRFLSPDAVVMHPRRWSYIASYLDAQGRPLIVPTSGGFNALATRDDVQGYGHVGEILGMAVYTDSNIPTNLGAGSNQDVILVMPRADLIHWSSPPQAETFDAPYADSMGVLYRIFSYHGLIVDRYAASLGQIQGTGLVAPTYSS